MNGVRNRGSNARQDDLAEAFRADRIKREVGFIDKFDRVITDVGVHRHVVLCDIGVEESTKSWVDFARLSKASADAPYQPAKNLTSRRSCAEDLAAIDDADGARNAHLVGLGVNGDLDK